MRLRFVSFSLATDPVVVLVQPVVIDADDLDFSRVIRAITAAAFAVVIGGVGIEAGAGVIGIAFAFFARRRFGLFCLPLFAILGHGELSLFAFFLMFLTNLELVAMMSAPARRCLLCSDLGLVAGLGLLLLRETLSLSLGSVMSASLGSSQMRSRLRARAA